MKPFPATSVYVLYHTRAPAVSGYFSINISYFISVKQRHLVQVHSLVVISRL